MHIGSIYHTNSCGNVEVLDVANDKAVVRFLNTGTEKQFRTCWIKDGCIRDPYAKSLCGVACTGDIKTKGKYKPYYAVWHDMINRCYNQNNKRAGAYSTVFVDDRWLVFENFYNDCKEIDGFDEELFVLGKLVLDKDIKQRYSRSKIYSKDTCVWVDKHTNNRIQDGQQKPFVAISPFGKEYHSYNITDFAREHGLNRKNISAVLHGRGKTVHGWRFSYEEIV